MPPPETDSPSPRVPDPDTPGRSLLIVEHNQPVAQVLAEALEGEFDRIRVAESMAEITRLLPEGAPGFDVVLCDHTLPDASGQDVRRWLEERTPPGGRHPAFVLMAGSLPGFRRAASREVVLLPKPFTIDDLHGAIAEAQEAVERGEPNHPAG